MLPNGLTDTEADKFKQELLASNSIALCTEPKTLSYLCGEPVAKGTFKNMMERDFCLEREGGGLVYTHATELFPSPESARAYFADPKPEALLHSDFANRLRALRSYSTFPERRLLYPKNFADQVKKDIADLLQDSRMWRWRSSLPEYMREHEYDPEIMRVVRWSYDYAPSLQELIGRNREEHLLHNMKGAAEKLMNPYDPALLKARETMAGLIAGAADPEMVRHAIREKCPIIFSTHWFNSWLLTSSIKGGLTDKIPFSGGPATSARNCRPTKP